MKKAILIFFVVCLIGLGCHPVVTPNNTPEAGTDLMAGGGFVVGC